MARDYYQELQDINERELFDKTIQISNAKAEANKYASQTLKAQGYGSQGYGANIQIAQNNQFNNELANAKKTYYDNLSEINLERHNNKVNNAQSTFTTALSEVANQNNYNGMMNAFETYGFVKKNNDGTYFIDTNNENYQYLNEAQQKQLNTTFNEIEANKDTMNITSRQGYTKDNIGTTWLYSDGKMVSEDIANVLEYETSNMLLRADIDGSGTAYHLQNNKGQNNAYFLYMNGQYYHMTPEEYANYKGNKHHLRYKHTI